ncbi:MAG: RluA family pseudouridine synthase [Patescibacteria group bacterium]
MEDIKEIKIIYEDESLLVVDKPAGILVHETQAKEKNTLANWLVNKYPEIKNLNWPDATRQGIVHRIDKDTSGLIILAKHPEILEKLQQQFKQRKVQKTYTALVLGKVEPAEGKIEAAIIRGKAGVQQVREFNFSVGNEKLRPAITFYETTNQYKFNDNDLTLVLAMPRTGRMHQIRTHLKHIGHPIIGDQLYNNKQSKRISKEFGLSRQFLHATKLEFSHPTSGKLLIFRSDLPKDLKNIMVKL